MRTLALFFLTALGLALGAGPASAGGPTSVLITSPAESRATALYHTETAYTELQTLLDAGEAVAGSSDYDSGAYINVTWLIHDIDIWRTDRILLDAPGGAVVETTMHLDPDGGSSSVRRTLAKPVQLTALLSSLGMDSPREYAERVVVPAAQQAPLEGSDARWEWGIGGVLVGLLVGVLFWRIRAVR